MSMDKRLKIGGLALRAACRRELATFLNVTVGTLLICLCIAALIEPYQFASTGVTGVGLITNYLWGISPVWVLTGGNALLLAWGWKALSPRFALWTLYNTLLTTLALPLFEMFRYPLISNTILAALFGGVVGASAWASSFAKALRPAAWTWRRPWRKNAGAWTSARRRSSSTSASSCCPSWPSISSASSWELSASTWNPSSSTG